mmetsp:Transcript_146382/g.272595  ORF Transcript_146382/g.272595 Transcript_146382/m.272595 type:complete len:116 (-) Transcript_146382:7-354(-)
MTPPASASAKDIWKGVGALRGRSTTPAPKEVESPAIKDLSNASYRTSAAACAATSRRSDISRKLSKLGCFESLAQYRRLVRAAIDSSMSIADKTTRRNMAITSNAKELAECRCNV